MAGEPVQVVRQLLGHARIEETMRYAHLSPHFRKDAVAKLDDVIGGASDGPQVVHDLEDEE